NFLRLMGYSLREVLGQHHSIFCTPDYIRSQEYRDFWLNLNNGALHSGRFHRIGKFDRDVYIQATYNPILDFSGNPVRI
ncbi:PAS domain-containing protein, partial [Acinetobacter baumannii]